VSEPAFQCVFERIFQAWDYARVEAIINAGNRSITAVRLLDPDGTAVDGGEATFSPHETLPTFTRATLSCLVGEVDLTAYQLEVRVDGEAEPRHVPLVVNQDLSELREIPLFERFRDLVMAHPAPRVLEVGGRDRSGVSHRDRLPPVAEYVGLDVLPGPGVDVVADAHVMSDVLGAERFDFACSYYVWEHLAMPWKAVIELNRILVTGGYALIVAPQTCGLHDLPWDYFRFSDAAFRALFAPETGFEVLDVTRHDPMHLFPFISRRAFTRDEDAAGFFSVVALVRKVGPTSLEWPVSPEGIVEAPYPE
jgi:SAM-dependent methyltransferase